MSSLDIPTVGDTPVTNILSVSFMVDRTGVEVDNNYGNNNSPMEQPWNVNNDTNRSIICTLEYTAW